MTSTAVAKVDPKASMLGLSFSEIVEIGNVFAASGLIRDSQDAAAAITKIVAGQELGIGPMQAVVGIHVIEGKPAIGAGLVGALVKRSGRYNYRVKVADANSCVLVWTESGEVVGESSFTIEEADAAGYTTSKSGRAGGWQKSPSDMLFARALTRGARRFCPDVFGGAVYVPDEVEENQLDSVPMGTVAPDSKTPPQPPRDLPITKDQVADMRDAAGNLTKVEARNVLCSIAIDPDRILQTQFSHACEALRAAAAALPEAEPVEVEVEP